MTFNANSMNRKEKSKLSIKSCILKVVYMGSNATAVNCAVCAAISEPDKLSGWPSSSEASARLQGGLWRIPVDSAHNCHAGLASFSIEMETACQAFCWQGLQHMAQWHGPINGVTAQRRGEMQRQIWHKKKMTGLWVKGWGFQPWFKWQDGFSFVLFRGG